MLYAVFKDIFMKLKYLNFAGGSSCRIVANVLHCVIVGSKFKI